MGPPKFDQRFPTRQLVIGIYSSFYKKVDRAPYHAVYGIARDSQTGMDLLRGQVSSETTVAKGP
jgi:hypothetical protein